MSQVDTIGMELVDSKAMPAAANRFLQGDLCTLRLLQPNTLLFKLSLQHAVVSPCPCQAFEGWCSVSI